MVKAWLAAILVAVVSSCSNAPSAKPAPAESPKVAAPAPAPTPAPAPVAAPTPPPPPPPPPAVVTNPDPPKKKASGPLGLPAVAVLKEDVGLQQAQLKKCREIYAAYKDKATEAQTKARNAAAGDDKKAASKQSRALKEEILGKIREVCDDEQKKKLDALTAPKNKKQ